jgi:type III secretion system low calcium response chaperone LcrH/SycD
VTFQTLIQKAEGTPPIDTEAFYAQAYAHYQAHQSSEAAEFFTVLCARKPMESRFWLGLAASLQESQHYEKALSAWAMAALLEPKDPYPHFHAAQCAFSLNQMEDAFLALKEARQIIEQDPAHPLKEPIAVFEKQWRNL